MPTSYLDFEVEKGFNFASGSRPFGFPFTMLTVLKETNSQQKYKATFLERLVSQYISLDLWSQSEDEGHFEAA